MKNSYTDKQTGIDYALVGEIYLPNFVLPHSDYTIGVWGERYRAYIKAHRRPFYTSLKMLCKLNAHQREVDTRASEMFGYLVKQLAEKEGITEALKAEDMMAWVAAMNNISNRAREIVWDEIINH